MRMLHRQVYKGMVHTCVSTCRTDKWEKRWCTHEHAHLGAQGCACARVGQYIGCNAQHCEKRFFISSAALSAKA